MDLTLFLSGIADAAWSNWSYHLDVSTMKGEQVTSVDGLHGTEYMLSGLDPYTVYNVSMYSYK